jgi:hypothetical protein
MKNVRNSQAITIAPQCHAVTPAKCCVTAAGKLMSALALTALVSASAQAGDLSLLVNGKAMHIAAPASKNYNERNWGAGVQYDFDAIGQNKNWIPFATASGFKDSFNQPSYYAGGGYTRRFIPLSSYDTLHVDAGFMAFFMTREDYKNNHPFFGMLPVMSVGTKRVAINMTYVPKVQPKMVSLVFIQLKITLGTIK